MQQRNSGLTVTAFVLAGALWGAGFPFGKLAFAELGPAHVVLYRFVLATLVLLPFAVAQRCRPRRADLPLFLLTGVLTVPVTFLLQFAGLTMTTAASAALIMGAAPPVLALAAVAFYRERLDGVGWAAVAASTVGVVLIVGRPAAGHNWLGDALVFLSVFAVVASVLLAKELVQRYPALAATAYIMLFGTLTLAPVALLWDGPPKLALSAPVWGSVLVLGIGSSALSNLFYNWGLGRYDASRAGVYLNLEPLVGALLGVALLSERLGSAAVAGGALIVAAAFYVSRPAPAPAAALAEMEG